MTSDVQSTDMEEDNVTVKRRNVSKPLRFLKLSNCSESSEDEMHNTQIEIQRPPIFTVESTLPQESGDEEPQPSCLKEGNSDVTPGKMLDKIKPVTRSAAVVSVIQRSRTMQLRDSKAIKTKRQNTKKLQNPNKNDRSESDNEIAFEPTDSSDSDEVMEWDENDCVGCGENYHAMCGLPPLATRRMHEIRKPLRLLWKKTYFSKGQNISRGKPVIGKPKVTKIKTKKATQSASSSDEDLEVPIFDDFSDAIDYADKACAGCGEENSQITKSEKWVQCLRGFTTPVPSGLHHPLHSSFKSGTN
ncbi:hypothetical protein FQR65_LT16986 [Abscondita terminalis]|nr:hypothetical protein FQR65_LT16986 [Abscondita terminalis]